MVYDDVRKLGMMKMEWDVVIGRKLCTEIREKEKKTWNVVTVNT